MYPYNAKICQKLHDGEFERRADFCLWFLQKDEEDFTFTGRLIMSDEAHFGLNESVNRQNFKFWGSENPMEMR